MMSGKALNPFDWPKHRRIGLFVMIVFGACIGFVAGVRRIDANVNQDLYWLWLAIWIVSGSLLAAAGVFAYGIFRPSKGKAEQPDR